MYRFFSELPVVTQADTLKSEDEVEMRVGSSLQCLLGSMSGLGEAKDEGGHRSG